MVVLLCFSICSHFFKLRAPIIVVPRHLTNNQLPKTLFKPLMLHRYVGRFFLGGGAVEACSVKLLKYGMMSCNQHLFVEVTSRARRTTDFSLYCQIFHQVFLINFHTWRLQILLKMKAPIYDLIIGFLLGCSIF